SALAYYQQADSLGDAFAAFEAGNLFYAQAVAASAQAEERQGLFSRAGYYWEKATQVLENLDVQEAWAAEAWLKLGTMRWHGEDGRTDSKKALECLDTAANQKPNEHNAEARRQAMEMLANTVYGAKSSPYYLPHRRQYWLNLLEEKPENPEKASGAPKPVESGIKHWISKLLGR